MNEDEPMVQQTQIAVFGGGCFWCTEAVFQRVNGVTSVTPGYAGGQLKNPSYRAVCGGDTGHAEVIRVEFDPAQVSYGDLLSVFFATHDPTTLNRQGHDNGTQYRSIILYANDDQKRVAEALVQSLSESGEFPARIVTEVKPLDVFYEAEDYHRDYYSNNPNQPYCQFVIDPKVEKFEKRFHHLLKPQ
jgi:peptide-methionine (S)-S-oxide reductase